VIDPMTVEESDRMPGTLQYDQSNPRHHAARLSVAMRKSALMAN